MELTGLWADEVEDVQIRKEALRLAKASRKASFNMDIHKELTQY